MTGIIKHTRKPFVSLESYIDDFFNNIDLLPADRLFNRLNRSFFGNDLMPAGDTYPKVDVVDYSDRVEVQATVVGLSKDDLEVQVKTDVNGNKSLILKSDNKFDDKKEGGSYRYREIKRSRFLRSFPLPASLDSTAITSNVENGLLTISIPKVEREEPKKETYETIDIR